jgi:hypothetical protein
MKPMAIYAALLTSWFQSVHASPGDTEAKASKLVEQLASDSFRDREKAARELVHLGAASKQALEQGCLSNDAEVVYRCQKLLPLAYEFYVHQILEAYAAKADGVLPEELPCAKRWLEVAGVSKESTELYIEVVKKHRALLLQVAQTPHSVTDLQRKFTQELAQKIRPAEGGLMRADVLTQGELALFLFLSADPNLNRNLTEPGVNGYLPTYQILSQTNWSNLLAGKGGSAPFKKLYVEYLGTQNNTNILRRALQLAVTADLKEAIPTALKLAKDKNTLGTIRAYAVTAMSKLGSKETVAELQPFLEDTTIVATVRVNNEQKQVEMRDLALGVSLVLAGQTMTEYGFDRNPPATSTLTVSYIYFSFSAPEKRDEAMKKWKEFAKKEKLVK